MRTEYRTASGYLFLALAVVALATACTRDAGPAAPTAGLPAATAEPATTAPTPTHSPSPTAAGRQPVFPRHDEAISPNRGDRYVYGELSVVRDCLRISYVDQVDREGTRDGLLVVWPAGLDVRTVDDTVEVTRPGGIVAAAEGQTVRISGKKVSRQSMAIDRWDWQGGDIGHCAGPFWLVGDEVTAMRPGTSEAKPSGGIYLPRLNHQRGPIISPLAGLEGRLTLRGRCLRVETAYPPGSYLVVWPPGFSVDMTGNNLAVVNGGGSVIAQVGEDVALGGRSGKTGSDYSDECPGAYFLAYSVQRVGQ